MFAMMAGEAEAGNLPISGIPLGPADPGGMNNVLADPSGPGSQHSCCAASGHEKKNATFITVPT